MLYLMDGRPDKDVRTPLLFFADHYTSLRIPQVVCPVALAESHRVVSGRSPFIFGGGGVFLWLVSLYLTKPLRASPLGVGREPAIFEEASAALVRLPMWVVPWMYWQCDEAAIGKMQGHLFFGAM